MLAAIEETGRVMSPDVKRQEPVTAGLTSKRRNEQQHDEAFGNVETLRPKNAVFSAIGTGECARHSLSAWCERSDSVKSIADLEFCALVERPRVGLGGSVLLS